MEFLRPRSSPPPAILPPGIRPVSAGVRTSPPPLRATPAPAPPPARISVVETVYHQATGKQPASPAVSRFSCWLASDARPCVKSSDVGPNPTMLDCGWATDASMVVVANEGPPARAVRPTPDEAAADAALVVGLWFGAFPGHPSPFDGDELAVRPPDIVVRPGETIRFSPGPDALSGVMARCLAGPVRICVTAFPL